MSQTLIDSGLLSEKQIAGYKENIGVYLTRSYKTHSEPKKSSILKSIDKLIFGKRGHDLNAIKQNQDLYNRAKDYIRYT